MATAVCVAFVIACLLWVAYSNPIPDNANDYRKMRAELIDSEICLRLGNGIVLNEQEQILNQFIVKEKRQLMIDSRLNRTGYFPAVSFFMSKPWIENTAIFKIIKEMPKGAALHLHDLAIASIDWIVQNATYRDNVYMCVDSEYFILLSAFETPPANASCEWKLVNAVRNNSTNQTEFDLNLKRNISMLSTDPLVSYPTVDIVWDRFNKYFAQVINLLSYAPIMRDYYRQALVEFRDDNVQYIELRSQLLYNELNGTVHDADYGVRLYKEVTDDFVKQHTDFIGAKIISSSLRVKTNQEILEDVKTAIELNEKYKDFFKGYDLVGQEDPNESLLYYIDTLLYPTKNKKNLPFFFHAGETKWQGTDSDYNLADALLLNTVRIGHGYALAKHPKLVEIVKARKVAVEVSPISNQLLGMVSDLRNHPMATLMAQNVPIVISSDDPGTWEAAPLSHDYYVAFMDMTGEDSDLRVLKQFAINSIEYSAMSDTEKTAALKLWQAKWDTFVKETISKWNLKADKNIVIANPECHAEIPATTTPKGNNSSPSVHGLQLAIIVSLCLTLSRIFESL